MSETQPVPNVTFHALSDQPAKVFVHLGDKVRTFTETNMKRLPLVLQNVLIAEFGLKQEDAEAVTKDAMASHGAMTAGADHVSLLQEQMADNDKQLTQALNDKTKAQSDLSLVQSDLRAANKTIDDLRSQITASKEPPAAPAGPNTSAPNGGETSTGASAAVGTKPWEQTPAAQQTHNPPAMGTTTQPMGVQTSSAAPASQTDTGSGRVPAIPGGAQEAH